MQWMILLVMFGALGDDPADLCQSGSRRFSEGKLDDAAALLERAVQQGADARCWKALGVVYAAQGKYDAAERPFHAACESEPRLPDACLYYGRTLYLLNRFNAALKTLRTVPAGSGSIVETHRLTALSFEGLGRTADAETEYRGAIRLAGFPAGGPTAANEDPGIDYGVFLFRQGRTEISIAPLEAALQRHPNSSRAELELGRSLAALDRLDLAAAHLEKAVALEPDSSRAHLLLGRVYQRLGKADAAAEHLRQGSLTAK